MFIKDLSAFAAAAHPDCAASSVKADQAADKAASQELPLPWLTCWAARRECAATGERWADEAMSQDY